MTFIKNLERRFKSVLISCLRCLIPVSEQFDDLYDKKETIRKVLVIRLENKMGNLTMTTFFPKALRSIYPDSRIDLLVYGTLRPIWDHNPDIGKIFSFSHNIHLKNPFRLIGLLINIRQEKYDIVIDSSNPGSMSVSNGLLTRLTGAIYRVGFRRGESGRFLNVTKEPDHSKHYIEMWNDLLVLLDPGTGLFEPEIYVDNKEIESAGNLLNSIGINRKNRLVLISVGARNNQLDLKHFIELGETLKSETETEVCYLCSIFEKKLYSALKNMVNVKALMIEDKRALVSVINSAELFVSGDGGLVHLAYALKVKTVDIFLRDIAHNYGYEDGKYHRNVMLPERSNKQYEIVSISEKSMREIINISKETLNLE